MIQRVQTVWMLVTVVLLAALVPGALRGDLWAAIALTTGALVPLVAVFCFRNLSRQVSMLIAEFVLLVGCAGFVVYGAWFAHTVWAYAPLFVFAAFVTNWLALRGALKDRMLLRDSERLR